MASGNNSFLDGFSLDQMTTATTTKLLQQKLSFKKFSNVEFKINLFIFLHNRKKNEIQHYSLVM